MEMAPKLRSFSSLHSLLFILFSLFSSMESDKISFRPSSRVSLPPTARRSICLSSSCRRACVTRRNLSWITLQGATPARAVGTGLSGAAAWEMFSPVHGVLLVVIVAAATAKSGAAREIRELKRSVDLRDRALEAMQLKHDSLCQKMISIQDSVGTKPENSDNSDMKNLVEQEERRMSDLSDFCWSVASSFDNNQLSSSASEQELHNLRKECEEKDVTIKNLLSAVEASKTVDAKRITELEELVKRKNLIISKLKKDMAVLERMVIDFTRSRRVSSPVLSLNSTKEEIPIMVNNVLFDMSSSSSSSDSESPFASKENPFDDSVIAEKKIFRKISSKKTEQATEKQTKGKIESKGAVRERKISASSSESFKRTRRGTQHEPRSASQTQRRWL